MRIVDSDGKLSFYLLYLVLVDALNFFVVCNAKQNLAAATIEEGTDSLVDAFGEFIFALFEL